MADDSSQRGTFRKQTVRLPWAEPAAQASGEDAQHEWLSAIRRTLSTASRPSSVERCPCACRIESAEGPTLDRPGLLDAEGVTFSEVLPFPSSVRLLASLSLGQREDEVLTVGRLDSNGRYLRFERVVRGSWELERALAPLAAAFSVPGDGGLVTPEPPSPDANVDVSAAVPPPRPGSDH